MKTIIRFKITLICLVTAISLNSQVLIDKSGTSINEQVASSASLELRSVSQGFLPPRVTKAEMQAIESPAEGLLVYCRDCDLVGIYIFDGTNYVNLTDPDTFVEGGGGNNGGDSTEVVDVTSATGEIWMDRNLGATQVAIASNDHLAYGNLYQWGRGNDGHQLITRTSSTEGVAQNGTTTTIFTSPDTGGNSNFVLLDTSTPGVDGNWTNFTPINGVEENNLWNGTVKGVNDPCPDGYRVPSSVELQNEIDAVSGADRLEALFQSSLKLTAAGTRIPLNTADVSDSGESGGYWSSTVNSTQSNVLTISPIIAAISSNYRALGVSVRCIKND